MQTTAIGIEKPWRNLQVEFTRSGPGIPGATHYKTISLRGPELFATLDENQVFYHDNGQWYRYITAANVQFGQINTTEDISRATTEKANQLIFDAFSQEEKVGVEDDDSLL